MGFHRPEDKQRYIYDGINTNELPDVLPPNKYPVAFNIRRGQDLGVQTRPGYTELFTTQTVSSGGGGGSTQLEFTGDSFIEAFDLGLGSDVNGIFYERSMFLLPVDGYDTDRVNYYLEMVGYDNDLSDRDWQVQPVTAIDATGVHTGDAQLITMAAGYAGRVRSTTPFLATSPLNLYVVTSPIASGSNTNICSRMRVAVQHTSARKLVSEIRLTNSGSATELDQSIGGGDLFRTTSFGLPNETDGFVSVEGPRWTYRSADWGTVTSIKFWVIMANANLDNVNKWSEFALWDVTADAIVAYQVTSACSFAPRYFDISFGPDDLNKFIDGHVYEMRVRSVKTDLGLFNFNTYVHKGRLLIYVDPLSAYELHNRCGNSVGVAESRALYAGGILPASDLVYEFQGESGVRSALHDYGASDTATTEIPPLPMSETTITDAVAKSSRSQDISLDLVAGRRYSAAVYQGSIVTKYPRTALVRGFTPTTPRQDYLAELFDLRRLPVMAVLFEEGAGIPKEFFTGADLNIGGAPTWIVDPTYGTAGKAPTVNDYWGINQGDGNIANGYATVLCIRQKRDLTARAGSLLGSGDGFFGNRLDCDVPWSDGKVYFDFGGASEPDTRIIVTTYVPSTDLEAWVFKAGPNGLAVWKDGVSLKTGGSNANKGLNDTSDFQINRSGTTLSGDLQNIFFFALIRYEVEDSILANFTVNHVLLGV